MSDVDDIVLLREYVDGNSESAFAGIVQRHINLVYSVALRFTGNTEDAQDVAQTVFIILAKKAAGLRAKTILTGWLYETTRFTAMNFLTNKKRRQAREQEACMESTSSDAEIETIWPQLVPLLENAMSRLNEKDRMLVALRFFENRGMAETAALLGVNEWAARKRVERTLEKLRVYFSKRGVNCTAATIASAISVNSIQAAPIGLAKTVSAMALAKSAAASTSTVTIARGALKVMAWSKAKTTVVSIAVALLGIGATTIVVDGLLPVPDIQGTWECTANLPGHGAFMGQSPKTSLVLRIAKVNGAYQASMEDIGWGEQNIGFDTFTYQFPTVHAKITSDDRSFAGNVDRSGQNMSLKILRDETVVGMAEFKRTVNPTPFPEALTDAEFAPRAGSPLQGFWVGTIGWGTNAIHIRAKIAEADDGTFRADFYSPDQTTNRQPATVKYDGITVKLMPMDGYGIFEGQLRKGGREMAGNWIQNSARSPVTLTQANYSEYQAR